MTDDAPDPSDTAPWPAGPAAATDPLDVTVAVGPRGRRSGGTLAPGARVGRYVVQHELARGGMGVVYQARDPELERGVALKLVRAGRSASGQARLLREAQALAQLTHPNVITVFDVGTHDGDVFLAMELVEGPSLRGWLRGARPWRETLRILLAAGRGLAAAHAAGMVHRDFKPDNVMIGRDGQVRVLDFGLARPALTASESDGATDADSDDDHGATDPALLDGETVAATDPRPRGLASQRLNAPLTAVGKIVGTPGYMSPEQHRGGGLDAVSDQFSFCVTAWEALTGAKPFAARDLAGLRAAKDAGRIEPAAGEARVPARLRRLLRRGLAPAPRDRFPSMTALLVALGRAVDAPRRRALIAVGATIALGAIALALRPTATTPPCRGADARLRGVWDAPTATATAAALRATGRPHARETARRVAGALDAYAADWLVMRLDSCQATHVRHDQSAALLDLRTRCLDRRLDEVRALVAVLRDRPSAEVADHAVEAVRALPDLAACADGAALRDLLALPTAAATRAQVIALDARLDQVAALTATAQYRAARTIVDDLVAAARAVDHPPLLARTLELLGDLQDQAGDADAAATTLQEAAMMAARAHDDRRAARALISLVWITGHGQARYPEALAMTGAVETQLARAGAPPELRSALDSRVGMLLSDQGRYDEAVATLARALATREATLGVDAPELAAVLNNLGEVARDAGRFDDAERYYRRALAIAERALGPEHPDVAAVLNNLGSVLWAQGRFPEADPLMRRSLALDEATFGADHPRVAVSLLNLGGFLHAQGRADARPYLERALAIQRRTLGPDHPELAMALHNLGAVIDVEGDHEGALGHFREALGILERARSPDHPHLAFPLVGIGDALVALGRVEDALPSYRRAIAVQDGAGTGADPDGAYALTSLGHALLLLRRPAEAIEPLERAVALRAATTVDATELARSRFLLADALWGGGGDRLRARTLATAAGAGFATDPEEAARVERWLAAHPGRR